MCSLARPKNEFIKDMKIIGPVTVVEKLKFRTNEEIRKAVFRRALGGLIWVGQTRYDSSFQIAKIATDYATAVSNPEETHSLIKLVNIAIGDAQSKLIAIWYLPFCNPSGGNALVISGKISNFCLL